MTASPKTLCFLGFWSFEQAQPAGEPSNGHGRTRPLQSYHSQHEHRADSPLKNQRPFFLDDDILDGAARRHTMVCPDGSLVGQTVNYSGNGVRTVLATARRVVDETCLGVSL